MCSEGAALFVLWGQLLQFYLHCIVVSPTESWLIWPASEQHVCLAVLLARSLELIYVT